MSFPALRDDLGVAEGYHSPQLDVEVRLNTNESPLPPPSGFLNELAEAAQTVCYNRYPDRQAWALREDLAALHGVRPEQVFVANGSNEVLQSVMLGFGGPGRKVATFEPTYAMYGTIARTTLTALVEGERGSDMTLSMQEVRRVMGEASPEITILTSPNNPTGMVEPAELVAATVAEAPGLVLVDEAYAQFAPHSALSLLDEDTPLVVTRTFSKTWSMAASRLGYLIGPERVVAPLWEKVALPYHLDSLKQQAGRLALRHSNEMEARVVSIIKGRERIMDGLAELAVTTWPSGANFVLFRPQKLEGNQVWQRLVERGVLVRNCSGWPRLGGCLRVTVGTPKENDRFLDALKEVLA